MDNEVLAKIGLLMFFGGLFILWSIFIIKTFQPEQPTYNPCMLIRTRYEYVPDIAGNYSCSQIKEMISLEVFPFVEAYTYETFSCSPGETKSWGSGNNAKKYFKEEYLERCI